MVAMASLQAQTTFNWVAQTICPGYDVLRLAEMPDSTLVIVGTNGVFQKSFDHGTSWQPLKVVDAVYDFSGLSICPDGTGFLSSRRSKLIDYDGLDDVYVDGRLLKTSDYGATWSLVDLAGFTSPVLATDPNKIASYAMDVYTVECVDASTVYAYSGWSDILSGTSKSCGAVFMSTDGGSSWTAITDDLGSSIVSCIETSGTNTYIGGGNLLFRKTGDVLTDIYPNLVSADGGSDQTIYTYDIDVVGENEFYLVTTNNGIFHSTDGGATITEMTGTGIPTGGNDIMQISANTILVLGTVANSKVTVDGGLNWTACSPSATCWEIGGIQNDSVVALAKDDIYRIAVSDLTAAPSNWKKQHITDLGINLSQMAVIDAERALIAGPAELAVSTTDKGLSWTSVTLPELYTQGDPGLEFSVDFKAITCNDSISYAIARRFRFVDFPTDSTQEDIYIPGPMYRSYDNWETWEMLKIDEIGKEAPNDVSINPFNPLCAGFEAFTIDNISDSLILIYADWFDYVDGPKDKTYRARMFRSEDGGASWQSVSEDFGTTYVPAIQLVDSKTGYYGGSGLLRKTVNGGVSFEDIYPLIDPNGTENMYFKKIVPVAEDTFCLVTVGDNIWFMTGEGSKFEKFPLLTGGNDFIRLDARHMMVFGPASKTFYTADSMATWQNCSPGTTIWSSGGIHNDSIYALTEGFIYKIALYDFIPRPVVIIEGTEKLLEEGAIRLLNRPEEVELVTTGEQLGSCRLYNLNGQLMETRVPEGNSCIFNKTPYPPGIYLIATDSGKEINVFKVIF